MIAVKLVLQHVDFVIKRHVQARFQVGRVNVVFDAVRHAVKTALAPSCQVE